MKRPLLLLPLVLVVLGCCGQETAQMKRIDRQITALKEQVESLKNVAAVLRESTLRNPAMAEHRDDVSPIVATAEQKLADHDYVAAVDFLLAAMRIDPSSPDVFTATLEFVQKAAASDNDEAIYLANDLYTRVGGLIPFQPVSQIENARKRYAATSGAFQLPMPPPTPDPLESIQTEIEALKNAELPADIVSLAVQRVRRNLESLGSGATFQTSDPEPEFWERWQATNHRLEELETEVLSRLYTKFHNQFTDWQKRAVDIRQQYQTADAKNNFQDFAPIGRSLIRVVEDGYQLRSDIQPFVTSGISEAKHDQDSLESHIDFLSKLREWIYNQHALVTMGNLQENTEARPLEKLLRLAEYDERRLTPYVQQRFRESWDSWFEELEETQKVEATKARILREVTQ